MLEEYSSAYQFQFTPLREGRHQRCEASVFGKYFNSRPSARGDARHLVNARNGVHFNSRPSARGDITCERRYPIDHISIHAPPRGATHASAAVPVN